MERTPDRDPARLAMQKGQGTVEFVLFLVILTFSLFLLFALTWIGVQKWQFNFFSAYAARTWSVEGEDANPEVVLVKVQAAAVAHRPSLVNSSLVKLMFAGSFQDGEDPQGIDYTGFAPPFPLYRRAAFQRGGLDASITGGLLDVGGIVDMVMFETFIPMQPEPDENTNGRDNDCSDYNVLTGACSGNGR